MKPARLILSAAALTLFASTALVVASAGSARANDSSASLETGGLRMVYNAEIEMKEEDLFLSKSRVRVRYVFANRSNHDVETLVAFPLPRIETGEGGNYIIDSADPINFIDFRVTAGGQPVVPQVEAKATAVGVDITPILAKWNLPVTTILPPDPAVRDLFWERMRTLPEEALADLERRGAITRSRDATGKTTDVNANWTASITFYWYQRFPSGQTIEITHEYRPVPRSFFTTVEELTNPEMTKRYCPDAGFVAKAKEMATRGTLSGVELRYIVQTANNWWGPIGRFSLSVDKEDPKYVLSTCLQGLARSGPTVFSVSKPNWSPDADLGMLLLETVTGN